VMQPKCVHITSSRRGAAALCAFTPRAPSELKNGAATHAPPNPRKKSLRFTHSCSSAARGRRAGEFFHAPRVKGSRRSETRRS
jgi:hypothetical protein